MIKFHGEAHERTGDSVYGLTVGRGLVQARLPALIFAPAQHYIKKKKHYYRKHLRKLSCLPFLMQPSNLVN